ncbi:MAG: Tn3 family transposase, partial [Enterobacter sp.]
RRIDSSKPTCRQNRCCKNGSDHRFRFPSGPQEALSWMRSNGEETGVENIARLSPLMHGHINMLGHYTFTLPEDIVKGELRALNFNINSELSSQRTFAFHWASNPS